MREREARVLSSPFTHSFTASPALSFPLSPTLLICFSSPLFFISFILHFFYFSHSSSLLPSSLSFFESSLTVISYFSPNIFFFHRFSLFFCIFFVFSQPSLVLHHAFTFVFLVSFIILSFRNGCPECLQWIPVFQVRFFLFSLPLTLPFFIFIPASFAEARSYAR